MHVIFFGESYRVRPVAGGDVVVDQQSGDVVHPFVLVSAEFAVKGPRVPVQQHSTNEQEHENGQCWPHHAAPCSCFSSLS